MNENTIDRTAHKLRNLHKDAKKDYMRIGKGVLKSIFRPIQPIDFENVYLPISDQQGQFLRQTIVENDCQQVVEFGTSFGISTIYLADGVRQTGGKVISTELLSSKAQKAEQNVREAGLSDYVEIRTGDAMETLKDHAIPIDFLFLDGWKDLYLPLLRMLEPQFHNGTLIYADNMGMSGTENYINYILKNNSIYSSKSVHQNTGLFTRVIDGSN